MNESSRNNQPDGIEVKGYLSPSAKRRFTNIAGIFCIVFLLAQFVVPMAMMFSIMPKMMSGMMHMIEPQSGASWQDKIWYLESGPTNDRDDFFTEGPGEFKKTLKYLTPGAEKTPEPTTVMDLAQDNPKILAADDRLWIVSSSSITSINDAGQISVTDDFVLGDFSRPFLYQENPAIIEEHPGGYSLMVFRNAKWHELSGFTYESKENSCCFLTNLRVVPESNGRLLFFLKQGGTLFYRDRLPDSSETDRSAWQSVANVGSKWDVVLLQETPTVFYQEKQEEHSGSQITGLSMSAHEWRQFFSHPTGMTADFAIYPFSDGSFTILRSGFPGSFSLINVDADLNADVQKSGSGSFFPKDMMMVMMTPQLVMMLMPFILALILTPLMHKYRVITFRSGAMATSYASLTKRAIAQVIDAAIVAGPIFIGWFSIIDSFADIDTFPGSPASGFGLMLGGFAWALTCIFFYSFMEGHWGISPGKWLVGIRVLGTDLVPCGFGRAVIRNLLKFVDGFFNFMVGIMIVALSDNWQRVGDMAARTIVVDIKEAGKEDLWEREKEQERRTHES